MSSSPGPPSIRSEPLPPAMLSSPPAPQIRSFPPRPKIVSSPEVPTITSSPEVPRMTPFCTVTPGLDGRPAHFLAFAAGAGSMTMPATRVKQTARVNDDFMAESGPGCGAVIRFPAGVSEKRARRLELSGSAVQGPDRAWKMLRQAGPPGSAALSVAGDGAKIRRVRATGTRLR
ncbi:protein of unknown function [Candidatus Methylocalor cossyra]|uniref:Uncharacterized protein n=1 Tax=Candidatus Methylocalor cossyra TaxID=3108543 RepID=A0ABM9NGJ9_9GAMM